MEGFIKLHRQIVNNWVWEDKPFSKGQAWVDLIIMANHCDKKFLLGSTIIDVQTGQIITSEHKLMKRWGWSKTKVRAFLELLETDKMLIKNSDKKKTTLTLCNYKEYHEMPNHQKTTERPVKDPIKNVKNDKNNKLPFETSSKPYQCAVYLDAEICKRVPKPEATEEQLQKSAKEFDLANRADGYDWELIESVLMFSQKSEFWKKNILSSRKFREKIVTLMSQMGGK